jgi:large subunit ribosomal protein L3
MKFILGKKLGMSQIFDQEGRIIPVTWIEAGPVFISQVKTIDKDGYQSIQVGFIKKEKKIKKTDKGKEYVYLKEFRTDGEVDMKTGQEINLSIFEEGDSIKISGVSKAKGYQGVVKRWGFRGGSKTHGNKHTLRKGGSIGSTDPARVFKGVKMSGRMGGDRKTVSGLNIVKIDSEKNLMAVRGAVPGRKGTVLEIKESK